MNLKLPHILLLAFALPAIALAEDEATRLAELDAYWAKVSKAVGTGDFEGYRATCHPEGILVSGVRGNSTRLSEALARWKKEFEATASGKVKSSVVFRFSRRIGNAETAHETGIFLYSTEGAEGERNAEHIHFEALLAKDEGVWRILMENQQSVATAEEWAALAPDAEKPTRD